MNVIDAIRNRRSVRKYAATPIPAEVLQRMKDALRLAPSACNIQPWRFVLVTDSTLRKEIAKAAGDQGFLAEAPVVVIGVGFPDEAYQHMGGYGNSVDVDIAIAIDHLTLAAAAEGLGTCWIGAFSEEPVKKLINAKANTKIVAMTPLGYPADPAMIHPVEASRRKKEGEVFLMNRFPG